MLEPSKNRVVEDSDKINDEDQEIELAVDKKFQYLKIPMIQDSSSFIYYLTSSFRQCHVMEGNPKDPYLKNHKSIFEIKVANCLAFSGNGDKFQLMDQNHIVHLLYR